MLVAVTFRDLPMPSVDLILNPRARHLGEESEVRKALLDAAREVGAVVHETGELIELDSAARSIAARGSTAVILAGGDGSYMAGVTALVRAFGDRATPPIALAPGGTVGTVARNWGGARSGSAAARAANVVRRAARGGETVRRPTLRVSDDRGRDHVGFMLGAGLVAGFFDEYYAAPAQGYATAAKIVARVFVESFAPERGARARSLASRVLEPVPAKLVVDGAEAAPERWSLVLASVIRDVGLHMLVTPRAGETPGAFHVVASPLGPRELGPQMPRVLAGRRLRGEGHVDVPAARELTIRFGAANEPEERAYVLDGDVLRAREVRVSAGPSVEVLRL